MHISKSFAIVFRPHPNLAYHIHGPSKSTPAIWSVEIHPHDLVHQNPVLQIPGFEVFWSFKFQVLQIQSPLCDFPITSSSQRNAKETASRPLHDLGSQDYIAEPVATDAYHNKIIRYTGWAKKPDLFER